MRKTKTYKVKVEFVLEEDEVSISLKPGRKLKKAVKNSVRPFGIDPEAALALFAEQTKKIPVGMFDELSLKPNRETRKAMKEVEAMLKDPSKLKTYTVEEAFAKLLK